MKKSESPRRKYGKIAPSGEAPEILREILEELGCGEVALVRNPSYIHAPLEIYPLPPKVTQPIDRIAGVVKDMDGTTTTTEPLCLHSLEWMVRRVTGLTDPAKWAGLDRVKDYPHIIGNSTTKHVEYLITTYADRFREEECLKSYIVCAAWTLSRGRDEARRREVRSNISALGLEPLLDNWEFLEAARAEAYDEENVEALAATLAPNLLGRFRIAALGDRVRAAVDIYYMRYHMILADIADGRGERRAREILGSAGARLIEPMPAVGVFLAALKGWLGEDLALFHDELLEHLRERRAGAGDSAAAGSNIDEEIGLKPRLAALGRFLADRPVPIAVVTSSIAYEAEIVLGEVFEILRDQVRDWPLDDEKKEPILAALAAPRQLYDAVVTASDSSEIRLKPHRDLYSIALHAMGLGHEDFPRVIGFEDSESGITAIRASGVGLAVALPFADTSGHDLGAAAHILHGQLPEALAVHNCFLSPSALEPYMK